CAEEPAVRWPGANAPPSPARFCTLPVPLSVPPVTVTPPLIVPLLAIVPAVLDNPPLSVPLLLAVPELVTSPDTVPGELLLKIPELVTVPVQVRLLLIVPVLAWTLPIQMPLLVMPVALLALVMTLPVQVPVALLVMVPVLVATSAL